MYAITLALLILIASSIVSINRLNNSSDTNFNKSNDSVDRQLSKCYINCSSNYSSSQKGSMIDYKTFKEDLNLAIAENAKKVRLAEEAKRIELARAEAERAKAEAEKKHREELEKERLRRQEEKKKQVPAVSRSNEKTVQWIQFEATYYSAFCNTGCTGVTALGWNVSNTILHDGHRVIAVDPSIIPLGSLVHVKTPNETFYALAGDTGGSIKQYRIDILVDSTKTAYSLGRHPVQVRVIKRN